MRLTDDYKPEYCEMLIEHMEKGYSFTTFAAKVKCARTTLYNWCERYPEFKNAKEMGEELAMMFFEDSLLKKARDTREGKNVDLGAVIFPLKTRFHRVYGEKKEVSAEVKMSAAFEIVEFDDQED